MTSNTKKEAENVLRVAREHLGEDKVGQGTLPFRASEDFGYYTMVKPGAFFFFCTKREEN
jgi:metal-dependent amidase/aminoacylase/carboxypeptidase family protein